MVYFKEIILSGHKYLHIVENENDTESGLKLIALPPRIGDYAPPRAKLDVTNQDILGQWSQKNFNCSFHQNAWSLKASPYSCSVEPIPSSSLGRNIITGVSYWGSLFRLRGEFCYTPKYWEWLEDTISRSEGILQKAQIFNDILCSRYTYDHNIDIMRAFCEAWCPKFNVLETSHGTISISLWDLQKFGGLPIYGDMYEETVPCLKELTGSCSRERILPKSCKYLFSAFFHLHEAKDGKKIVRISSWIDFWFRGVVRYNKPRKCVAKKSLRPKSTHNPKGSIPESSPWSREEQGVFEDLDVENDMRLPTYLSAFIACWLCLFVFPHNNAFIRPETFKVASLMASGKRFSLAVPVLATLYRGLNEISRSTVAGSPKACFPVHYVYGWLAFYFKTHYPVPSDVDGPLMAGFSGEGGARYYDNRAAREHIHNGENILWRANFFSRKGDFRIEDNSSLDEQLLEFFLSIRSCHLMMRYNNLFIAEPYNPTHFGRQFGFCQDIPYALKDDIRSFSLDNGFILWRLSMRSKTGSQLYIPTNPSTLSSYWTERYYKWWKTRHGDYLKQGINALIAGIRLPQRKSDAFREKPTGTKPIRISLKKKSAMLDLPPEGSSTATDEDRHFKRKRCQGPTPDDRIIHDSSHIPPLIDKLALPLEKEELEMIGESSEHSILSPLAEDPLKLNQIGGCSSQKHISLTKPSLIVNERICPEGNEGSASPSKNIVATIPAVSSFCLDSVASRAYKKFAISIWEDVKEKITRTPLSQGHTIAREIKNAIVLIDEREHIDLTPIRTLIEKYTEEVMNYSNLVATVGGTMTAVSRDKEVSLVRARLVKAKEDMKVVDSTKTTLQKRLADVDDEIEEIRKQLSKRVETKKDLETLVAKSMNEADEMDAEIVNLKDAMSTLKGAKVVGDANLQLLDDLRRQLGKTLDEIVQLHWEP